MTGLAARQAELVAALAASRAPDGFDSARLAVVSRALIHKRARTAARVSPRLFTALGELYPELFARYARNHALPERGGATADLAAFTCWLRKTKQLPDSIRPPSRFGSLLLILRRVAGIRLDGLRAPSRRDGVK